MTKYTFKYNFFILILRLAAIVGLLWTFGLIIRPIFEFGGLFDVSLFGLTVYLVVLVFILYRITKRLFTESNFITLDKGKIKIYNLVTFQTLIYQTTECIFFHSYRTPFDTIILKLPTGKYIHILPYDYFDYKKLGKILADRGMSNEGYLNDTTT